MMTTSESPPPSLLHHASSFNNESMYGGEYFQSFYEMYATIHLPLSTIICLFGVVTNTLNVIVLTRPSMLSPTNICFTGLSVSQLCLVSNYLALLLFNLCADACYARWFHSYSGVTYKWFNVNANVVLHKIAFAHTLILASWRMLALKAPTFTRTRLNVRTSKLTVLFTYILVPISCTPIFAMSYVAEKLNSCRFADVPVEQNDEINGDVQQQQQQHISYDLEYRDNPILIQVDMWLFGVVFKLIPSSALGALSAYLISSLNEYDKKKARLTTGGGGGDGAPNLAALATSVRKKKCDGKKRARKKQTKMLATVAMFCACVELPHGVVNLLTAVFGQQFAKEVYDNLGDLFEDATLLYSSVNFVLYSLMNKDYQKTFGRLFCEPLLRVWRRRRSPQVPPLLTEV